MYYIKYKYMEYSMHKKWKEHKVKSTIDMKTKWKTVLFAHHHHQPDTDWCESVVNRVISQNERQREKKKAVIDQTVRRDWFGIDV